MTTGAVAAYLVALALTLAIEVPLYTVGLGAGGAVAWRRATLSGVGVNLVSHPIAFLVAFPLLATAIRPVAALVAVEVGVVYLEALLLWRRRVSGPGRALALSSVANVASLGLGLAVLR